METSREFYKAESERLQQQKTDLEEEKAFYKNESEKFQELKTTVEQEREYYKDQTTVVSLFFLIIAPQRRVGSCLVSFRCYPPLLWMLPILIRFQMLDNISKLDGTRTLTLRIVSPDS